MSTLKRYWSSLPPIHIQSDKMAMDSFKSFDAQLTPEDVYEAQKIDADCNDCAFFKRGTMQKIGGLTKFVGICQRFNKPTTAWPMQYSGHECFLHRKEAAK